MVYYFKIVSLEYNWNTAHLKLHNNESGKKTVYAKFVSKKINKQVVKSLHYIYH